MFFTLTGLYKTKKKEECFICCSTGKSLKDNLFEELLSKQSIDYPLLSMSYIYGCRCSTNYAHNKCMLSITKCPTCRKESVPKLYKYTRYDYYFPLLLFWLRQDPSHFLQLKCYMLFCIIGTLSLQYLSNKIELVHTLVTINTNISFFFSLLSILFILFPVYILTIFSDYIKKYWLYNEKTHKYDVFKVMDNSDNIILVTIILQQRRYITSRELVINNLRRRISMLENHIVHLDTEEQTHLYFFEDL
jgi:hypothetical protein